MNTHPWGRGSDTITITTHRDPVVEAHGQPIRSTFVETFWLPILGPTGLWMLRRLSTLATPDGRVINLKELGDELGVSSSTAPNAVVPRTLDRLARYGAVVPTPTGCGVRTYLAPLTGYQRSRLPESLRSLLEREMVA